MNELIIIRKEVYKRRALCYYCVSLIRIVKCSIDLENVMKERLLFVLLCRNRKIPLGYTNNLLKGI